MKLKLKETELIRLIHKVINEDRELNPGEMKTKPIGSFTLCCLWFCADCEWTWGGGQWSPPAGTTGTAGKYANIAPNKSNKKLEKSNMKMDMRESKLIKIIRESIKGLTNEGTVRKWCWSPNSGGGKNGVKCCTRTANYSGRMGVCMGYFACHNESDCGLDNVSNNKDLRKN